MPRRFSAHRLWACRIERVFWRGRNTPMHFPRVPRERRQARDRARNRCEFFAQRCARGPPLALGLLPHGLGCHDRPIGSCRQALRRAWRARSDGLPGAVPQPRATFVMMRGEVPCLDRRAMRNASMVIDLSDRSLHGAIATSGPVQPHRSARAPSNCLTEVCLMALRDLHGVAEARCVGKRSAGPGQACHAA